MNTYFRKIIWGAFFIIGFTHCTKEITLERIKVQKQQQGATILSGQGAPTAQQGKVGDFYIDLLTTNLYGAKTPQGWGTPISLKGADGQDGTNGKDGQDGTNGQDGQDGQNGTDGKDGQDGKDGKDGQDGANGQDGQNGQNGQDGQNGTNGQNGRDGANIHKGTTSPDNVIGKVGDLYFDTANAKLYGPKTDAGWGQGIALGNSTTLQTNKNKVIVPINQLGTVAITLGSGQYQLDTPTTPNIAEINLQNAQRSIILIKGLKQGSTTITLRDTHTGEQLPIEVLICIPPSSYVLEDNGTTLSYWKGDETEIDMDADPVLKKVTKIKDQALFQNTKLTRIKLNEGLTVIERFAFYGTSNLTEIELPSTLTEIGDGAFGNTSIAHFNIPANVTTIGNKAFYIAQKLETITLHEGIQTIGYEAFLGCIKLQSIVIPNSVTSIGPRCFESCSALNSVTLPQNITTLEEKLFNGCINLTQLDIPNSVTSIKPSCFERCEALNNITLPPNITILEEKLFYNCTSLMQLQIPNSVTQIQDYALPPKASELTIPANVTHLGNISSNYLATLILKGSTPPIIVGNPSLIFLHNLQHIYVPATSVDTYKNADFWKDKATIIKPQP